MNCINLFKLPVYLDMSNQHNCNKKGATIYRLTTEFESTRAITIKQFFASGSVKTSLRRIYNCLIQEIGFIWHHNMLGYLPANSICFRTKQFPRTNPEVNCALPEIRGYLLGSYEIVTPFPFPVRDSDKYKFKRRESSFVFLIKRNNLSSL